MYATFKGKVAAVMSASPGAMGGMRNHPHARQLFQNLGVTVLPGSVALGGAFQAFDESGAVKDERQAGMLAATVGTLCETARFEVSP